MLCNERQTETERHDRELERQRETDRQGRKVEGREERRKFLRELVTL